VLYTLHFDQETITIRMNGAFTFHDARAFMKMLGVVQRSASGKEVRVNVANVESIDATALRLLMMAHDCAKKARAVMIFENPSGQVLARLNEAARHNFLNIAAVAA